MKGIWKIFLAILAVGVLGWLAFGFFGVHTLFVDREIQEEVPELILNINSQPINAVAAAKKNKENSSKGELLGKGSFKQGDSTYTISGNAFLSRIEGQRILTFTDFKVTNGPDLFVYAVKTNSTDNQTVKKTVANGDFINLGVLKGNIGNQNYALETELSSKGYHVISIWCRRFSRNFGSAHLAEKPLLPSL